MDISKNQLRVISEKYQQPGIYVILCLQTKKIYVGETNNLKNRFSDSRKMLHNGNHTCKELVQDVQKNGIHQFCFIPIYFGAEWDNLNTRIDAEKKLILFNHLIVYNTQHAAKIKQKREHLRLKERPNYLNGFPLCFSIEGHFLKVCQTFDAHLLFQEEIFCNVYTTMKIFRIGNLFIKL